MLFQHSLEEFINYFILSSVENIQIHILLILVSLILLVENIYNFFILKNDLLCLFYIFFLYTIFLEI